MEGVMDGAQADLGSAKFDANLRERGRERRGSSNVIYLEEK
jgi:hypothetical protein